MRRRDFIATTATGLFLLRSRNSFASDTAEGGKVITVLGEMSANRLGITLPHEHVMVDFIGAEKVSSNRYDPDDVFHVMLPYLKRARNVGCKSMAECTPAYLGRDAKLLKKLAMASGVNLITNTGFYGARQGKYLPRFAFEATVDQLAEHWTREWKDGIDGTDVRPGFIKLGVDAGKLAGVNQKLIRAAAKCHLSTGLTIAAHTGDGIAALQQVDDLRREGVSPSAWIWVHAQNERNFEIHRQVAKVGAWVEFDGVSNKEKSLKRHIEMVVNMKRAGMLDRVLVSHDAGWYSVGETNGGSVRGFNAVIKNFIPALRAAGISEREINQIFKANPAAAFSVKPRPHCS